MYRVISFDLDQTLYDFQSVMRHSLSKARDVLLARHPDVEPDLPIERMVEIRDRVATELKGKTVDLEETRREAFRRTLEDIGRPNDEFAEELNRVYRRHRFERAELFEDVLPALDRLQVGHVLGAISNGNSYPRHLGLDLYFVFVVLSQDVGVEKPDPRIFQIAAERVRCSADEMLHVGDSPESDVAGALTFGCAAAWYNREDETYPPDLPRPTYEIRKHTELLDIVGAK